MKVFTSKVEIVPFRDASARLFVSKALDVPMRLIKAPGGIARHMPRIPIRGGVWLIIVFHCIEIMR